MLLIVHVPHLIVSNLVLSSSSADPQFEDVENNLISQYPHIKIYHYTNIYPDIPVFQISIFRRPNRPISRYPNLPISQYPNTPITQYSNIPISQ